MIKREDVEALLAVAQKVAPASAVFGPERIGVEGPTLAELCRAWLALDEAPVGIVDIVTGWNDGSRAVEVYYENGPLNVEVKQRVRIVRETEDGS